MAQRAERLHRDDALNTTTAGDRGVDLTSFFEAIVETRAASQRKVRERMSIPVPTSIDDDLTRSSSGSLSFHDFVGYPDIKTKIRRILKTVPSDAVSSLLPQREESFAGLIAPMRGVVLHGPVGCGKTFLAKVRFLHSQYLQVGIVFGHIITLYRPDYCIGGEDELPVCALERSAVQVFRGHGEAAASAVCGRASIISVCALLRRL